MKKFISFLTVLTMLISALPVSAKNSLWSDEAIAWAEQNGFVAENAGFDYTKPITREQYTELIVKLYDILPGEKPEFLGELPEDTSDDKTSSQPNIDEILEDALNNEVDLEEIEEVAEEEEEETGEEIGEDLAEEEKIEEAPQDIDYGDIVGGWEMGKDNNLGELNQYEQISGERTLRIPNFTDTDNKAVKKAYSMWIINGVSDTEFNPDGVLTRQEAVQILGNLIFIHYPRVDPYVHGEYSFVDGWQISWWAENAVNFAYSNDILTGTDEYVISPLLTLTWEEAIAILHRAYNNIESIVTPAAAADEWEWYIAPSFDGLVPNTSFNHGLAAVKRDGKYGFINTNGTIVIPLEYDRAYDFSCGLARVEIDGRTGYVNRKGELVIPAIYESGGEFSHNLARVEQDGKFGFVDANGKTVIPFDYENAYDFSEGLASVKKNGMYGYIDTKGNTAIGFDFDWAAPFSEDRAAIGENGRYGYIDKTGKVIVEPQYLFANDFSNERAIVHWRTWVGVLDRDGNFVIPFYKYRFASDFSNGVAMLRLANSNTYDYASGNTYIVDVNGNILADAVGEVKYSEGLAAKTLQDMRSGKLLNYYFDKSMNITLPEREALYAISPDEENCYLFMDFHEGLAAVVNRKGKLGFIKNPLLSK